MGRQLEKIPVGTLLKAGPKTGQYLERFIEADIETVQLCFWYNIPEETDEKWMDNILVYCDKNRISVSALSLFADQFETHADFEKIKKDWKKLIRLAEHAGVQVISGFTGRVPGVDAGKSVEPVISFFTPIVDECEKRKIGLAFENCPMGGNWQSGNWNIAFCPEIWDTILNNKLVSEYIGLEFDPSHCIGYEQPAMKLLADWQSRIFHVHGKDAVLTSPEENPNGWLGPDAPYIEKFPGEGSLDWKAVFKILYSAGYESSVDIEGYHEKFISHEHEIDSQKRAVKYLKECR